MVFLAFSLQDQVEKYGAYVGIAAFFGLAVLTLLYFAQAREVKRLRAWAGRMPERAEDLEYAYEYAEEARRGPAPQPQPVAQPQPAARPVVQAQPVAVAPANGTVELKPEEVAALAFARAAGVHEPHLPKPHTAPVPVAAAATVAAPAPSQTVAAPPAPSTNGGGTGHAPPPATPAARRADSPPPRRTPPPAPPRRGAASPPPRREGNARAMIITGIVAVLVLVAVGFAFTQLGGDDEPQVGATPTATPGENEIGEDPTPEGGGTAEPTAAPGVTKDEAQIVVFNATSQTGLAATYETNLVEDGYPDGNIEVGNLGEAGQATTSTVMYARGNKSAAEQVADVLGIERVAQLDEATQAEAVKVGDREWNVVAIIGQDKSTG
jgi:hypothetical protein